jgi:hypothetical protein
MPLVLQSSDRGTRICRIAVPCSTCHVICYLSCLITCLQSKPQLEESLVVNSEDGTFMKSTVRTSSGAQFGRGFDAVFRRIEKRIASVTMIPVGTCCTVYICLWWFSNSVLPAYIGRWHALLSQHVLPVDVTLLLLQTMILRDAGAHFHAMEAAHINALPHHCDTRAAAEPATVTRSNQKQAEPAVFVVRHASLQSTRRVRRCCTTSMARSMTCITTPFTTPSTHASEY